VVNHNDVKLQYADTVSIKFEFQVKEEHNNIVTQFRIDHPLFSPVVAAAATAKRMRWLIKKGEANGKTPTYTFKTEDGKAELIGKIALSFLRDFIASIDYRSLGLVLENIGLHSLRAAAAMTMFLNGIPIPLTMLMGRWSL